MSVESEAWAGFLAMVQDAQAALDGHVPVALICLPAQGQDATGATRIDPGGMPRILWPSDVPIAERGLLLAGLARAYAAGVVQR